MYMKYTSNLSVFGKEDYLESGGKGASLGEMLSIGVPVPNGYVVLTSTFNYFLSKTDLTLEIESALLSVHKDNMSTVEAASEKIQQMILHAQLPTDIENEITEGFNSLGADYVAVRSRSLNISLMQRIIKAITIYFRARPSEFFFPPSGK